MEEERSVERDEAMTVPYVRAARRCTAAVVLAFAALVVRPASRGPPNRGDSRTAQEHFREHARPALCCRTSAGKNLTSKKAPP
ncbi:hypothetical protein [Actinacidiphila glaucinigra]|uniref:hypothetical protein n=1 Tax=Actinacidiphila glaucinigra TaxID=235986 RepID=UPI0037186727